MKELKVISKLFNQKDVLEVEGDKLAFKISVSNIETLTDAQLSELKVGDVVQKITGNQKHCYIVTYKEENHGICLSYFDAGYLETVSYDYTDGHWVFNSKDVCEVATKGYVNTKIGELDEKYVSKPTYEDISLDNITLPTITDVTITEGYCKIRKTVSGELHLVLNFDLENTSESPISIGNLFAVQITLPTELASQIIDVKGRNCTQTGEANGVTACQWYSALDSNPSAGFYYSGVLVISNWYSENIVACQYRSISQLPAGDTVHITARITLTI